MRAALHAEWTKFRTTGGPLWLLAGVAVLTAGLSAIAAGALNCTGTGNGCGDLTKTALTGVELGQAVVAVLAVLAVGTEYTTGLIRTTLTAVPRRLTVLTAKAVVITGPVLVAAAAGVLGSVLSARLLLPRQGHPPLSLADGPTLRAAAGSVLYLGLIALLSVGLAAVVREPGAAIGLVLGLLYLFPILVSVVTDVKWQRHLEQIAPSSAGLAIEATTGLRALPIGPWPGLGVLALWAAGALLAGAGVLLARDA